MKVRWGGTPQPARETRALPGATSTPLFGSNRLVRREKYSRARKVLRLEKRPIIDQAVRFDPADQAKKPIHDGKENPRGQMTPAARRLAKIGDQPLGIRGGGLGQLCNHRRQRLVREAIEKEMGHDQIVASLLERELPEIGLNEVHLRPSPEPRTRERNHTRARVHTIDLRPGMYPHELDKETSVAFADDEGPARRFDLPQQREPRLLELIAKNDSLERAIKRRDPVKTHRNEKGSASNGVSRTRSARAVR